MWKKTNTNTSLDPSVRLTLEWSHSISAPKRSLNLEFWKVKIFSLWHLHMRFWLWRTWQHNVTKASNKMHIKKSSYLPPFETISFGIHLQCPACKFERSHEHLWFYKSIGFDSWFVRSNRKALSCHLRVYPESNSKPPTNAKQNLRIFAPEFYHWKLNETKKKHHEPAPTNHLQNLWIRSNPGKVVRLWKIFQPVLSISLMKLPRFFVDGWYFCSIQYWKKSIWGGWNFR